MKQESILDKAALELFLAHNPNSHPATPIGQKLIAGFRKDVEILSLFFDITEKPSANPQKEPPQKEMMKGEGFTPGEWEITETESGSMSIAEKSDHSIICVLAEWRKERKANARLICQAPAMYAALNEVGPLLDGLINRTPSGYKRNELCDLNIKVKTILNQINNH